MYSFKWYRITCKLSPNIRREWTPYLTRFRDNEISLSTGYRKRTLKPKFETHIEYFFWNIKGQNLWYSWNWDLTQLLLTITINIINLVSNRKSLFPYIRFVFVETCDSNITKTANIMELIWYILHTIIIIIDFRRTINNTLISF